MKFTPNPLSNEAMLKKLNQRYGDGDWKAMLDNADYSLVANIDDFKKYPMYFDFENIENNQYVIEVHGNDIVNIYRIDEIGEYEYSCEEIFWETSDKWTEEPQEIAESIYILN